MNRDPRFARMQSKDLGQDSKVTTTATTTTTTTTTTPQLPKQQQQLDADDSEKEKDKRILEMDMSIFGELELPSFKENDATDGDNDEEEDRMGLPFKPHRMQPAAKEIDASICSHAPLDYKLRPLDLSKPDYSSLVTSIPVSRIQQDPRLRRYAKKRPLPIEPTVAALEPKASPTTVERPSDPRRKALPSSTPPQPQQSPSELPPVKLQGPGAYNPKNDLYSNKPSRQDDFEYGQKGPQADVYSPTQDVQDMYGQQQQRDGPARPNRPRDGSNFNPREENNFYDNEWSERQGNPQGQFRPRGGPNGPNWGQRGRGNNWNGPNSQGGPQVGFYDGPPEDYYGDERQDPGFNNYNNFEGFNNSQGGPRGGPRGNGPGGPPRNADPRGQRRDPRRRD